MGGLGCVLGDFWSILRAHGSPVIILSGLE